MNREENEERPADDETLPDTPLEAYKDGRDEDIVGDVDKLESSDPDDARRSEIADDDSEVAAPDDPPKH
jgi:hypothetical protein